MTTVYDRAEDFLWRNARLLERRLFAYRFRGGAREDVLAALRAYQNADGGFGNALEPDIRCPESQPVPVQHALEIADDVGFAQGLVVPVCGFLERITTAEGGVPYVLPSAQHYPHAPWWETSENPPAALNPTAAILGLLEKNGVRHAWVDRAREFCWPRIEVFEPTAMHDVACVITFLRYAPDRTRAEAQIERIGRAMADSGLVADPNNTGYTWTALDWAPAPDHPLRRFFEPATIDACLDAMIARQQPDGGWPIAWTPPGPAAEAEWRGWGTLSALTTLHVNGRLNRTT